MIEEKAAEVATKKIDLEFFKKHGSRGGKRAWKDLSAPERSKILSERVKAAWQKFTPEQRSALMKRRAKKRRMRAKNKLTAKKKPARKEGIDQ